MGEGKSFERRQELIAAALHEFTEWSYEAASLNRIITSAGISKGTFYYHFPSKEDLFFFLVDHAVQCRLEYVAARLPAPAVSGDLFEMMKVQAKIGVDFALEHPSLVQFALRTARESGPVSARLRERLGHRTANLLAPLVAGAMDRAEVRTDLGASFVGTLLSHMLLSFDQLFVDPHQPPDRDQVYADLDRYFEFIRHGLGGPTLKRG